jgi:hypothetical protein
MRSSLHPWLLLALLPLMLGSGSRFQQAHSPQPVDTSNERYIQDLRGSDASDRLYAARTLRSRLRMAIKDAERREGTLRQIDALASLDDFEVLVAPACLEVLDQRNVAHHCAQILGLLAYEPAREDLEALASPDSDTGCRARRQATKALEILASGS